MNQDSMVFTGRKTLLELIARVAFVSIYHSHSPLSRNEHNMSLFCLFLYLFNLI